MPLSAMGAWCNPIVELSKESKFFDAEALGELIWMRDDLIRGYNRNDNEKREELLKLFPLMKQNRPVSEVKAAYIFTRDVVLYGYNRNITEKVNETKRYLPLRRRIAQLQELWNDVIEGTIFYGYNRNINEKYELLQKLDKYDKSASEMKESWKFIDDVYWYGYNRTINEKMTVFDMMMKQRQSAAELKTLYQDEVLKPNNNDMKNDGQRSTEFALAIKMDNENYENPFNYRTWNSNTGTWTYTS